MEKTQPELTTLCYITRPSLANEIGDPTASVEGNKREVLMLLRNKKENDINHAKWIGVGGHFLLGESPDDCLRREVLEETGLLINKYQNRGVITFIYGKGVVEYMQLSLATDVQVENFESQTGKRKEETDFMSKRVSELPEQIRRITDYGRQKYREAKYAVKDCDEGELHWVPEKAISGLSLWPGDRIFLKLLFETEEFFDLKLVYDETGILEKAILDGKEIPHQELIETYGLEEKDLK